VELIEYVREMQNRFYGLTVSDLRSIALQPAQHNGFYHPFSKKYNLAGYDWTASFMNRHKLSLRTAEPTSMTRLTGFNLVQVTRFFDNLRDERKKRYSASQIYNTDEPGITTVQNPGKVTGQKSSQCQKKAQRLWRATYVSFTMSCLLTK